MYDRVTTDFRDGRPDQIVTTRHATHDDAQAAMTTLSQTQPSEVRTARWEQMNNDHTPHVTLAVLHRCGNCDALTTLGYDCAACDADPLGHPYQTR